MDLMVHPFFDSATSTFSYVLVNPATGCSAVVDPVLDYDPETEQVSTRSADRIIEFVTANGLRVEWLLETHVHADHLTAARYLKQQFVCAQTAIGAGVRDVQDRLAAAFGLDVPTDGRQFDRLLEDGERLCLGHACGRVMATPGHTPGCVTYVFDRFAFVGDLLLMPDYGTARCDFPGGDAAMLYRSVRSLHGLPDCTRVLVGHDYAPGGRDHRFYATVSDQKQHNRMLNDRTPESDFVARRRERDRALEPPRLYEAAVRANLVGGVVPRD
ncbi:MAG: MBL fold metallo-hydrolase [Pseudomonadota bacterium]